MREDTVQTTPGPAPAHRPIHRAHRSIGVGVALLPLRCFLAVTFLYAGLQKLANPDFLKWSSPFSLHSMMQGYARTSPIGGLVRSLIPYATAVAIAIALAELAVGIGIALGLLTRVAAVGGMLVSFTLFLVVSFHTHPWYTGADIVFLFAFTPLAIAGAGGVLSVDAVIARGAELDAGEVTRRGALLGGAAAALGLILAMADATIGRLAGGKGDTGSPVTLGTTGSGPTGSTGATGATGAQRVAIGAASSVPSGGSGQFTIPSSSPIPAQLQGLPGLVVNKNDAYLAYDAVCPHAGCTVFYDAQADLIACPCHGSTFAVATGDVLGGPAPTGLTKLDVVEDGGELYLT